MIRGQSIFARRTASALIHVSLAVVLVAVALTLTLTLKGVVSTAGYLFFYAAVVASAWFGGPLAGWLAVILSTLLVEYFLTPPVYSFGVDPQFLPVFIEFAASAAIVSWFSSSRKAAQMALERARDELQMRVEERTAELRHSNEQLLAEMAERKRTEEAYYKAQAELARVTRMNTMGALAASISHEVNQPLAAVVTNADACAMWLSSEPPNVDEARSAVDSISREGTRASEVIRRIRAMFTKETPERARVPVNDLIRGVADLMQAEALRNQVALRMELAADLPATIGDRVQLQQVIVNLIQNGIEAATAIDDRPRVVEIRSEMQGSNQVLIAVQDSGAGIEPGKERRIFDAFFTTKERGMGMGLSVSHSIVEAHGGRLWAGNNGDGDLGATLQFTLPAVPETGP